MNIDATLGTILHMLGYFSKDCKDVSLNNLKHRIKLLVNDVYGYLQDYEKFMVGISDGVERDIDNHKQTYGEIKNLMSLKNKYKWIFEHGLPWEIMFTMLINENITSTQHLLNFLKCNYPMCYVTREEDMLLNKYKHSMPNEWKPGDSWTIRYEMAGVKIYKLPKIIL